jgi:hypothetical protein
MPPATRPKPPAPRHDRQTGTTNPRPPRQPSRGLSLRDVAASRKGGSSWGHPPTRLGSSWGHPPTRLRPGLKSRTPINTAPGAIRGHKYASSRGHPPTRRPTAHRQVDWPSDRTPPACWWVSPTSPTSPACWRVSSTVCVGGCPRLCVPSRPPRLLPRRSLMGVLDRDVLDRDGTPPRESASLVGSRTPRGSPVAVTPPRCLIAAPVRTTFTAHGSSSLPWSPAN